MPRESAWRPVLADALAGEALEAAREVALRLARPGAAEEAVAAAREQSGEPRSVYWLPHGLAQGDAGVALLFGQLDRCFPEEGWDRLAHGALERGTATAGPGGRGLYSGMPGFAFAAGFLSREGRRYRRLLEGLDGEMGRLAEEALPDAGLAARDWDLVSGLTGLGTWLWTRGHPALSGVLERLSRLAAATAVGSGLFVSGSRIANPGLRAESPEGHLDCGLAHGIAGPLALLALAGGAGSPGVDLLADLLVAARSDDEWGPNWPAAAPARDGVLVPGVPTHAAWCYGSPGVARALWHAGRRDLAREAMGAVARRPPEARRLVAPGLCHGFGGLLLHALRFWHDTGEEAMEGLAVEMARRVLQDWDPDSRLGFRSVEPGGRRVDHAGFLEGAPGVALALLAAATDREPTWDRVLLLS